MRLDSILSSGFGHGETHSGAGWREPMYPIYTFTAGSSRTAGREGQGMADCD